MENQHHQGSRAGHGSYRRFFAMIATSTLVMWMLMYGLVFEADHLRFSNTRLFAALYMGAAMTLVMLVFMHHMLKDRRKNLLILTGAIVVFAASMFLARSQRFIGDVAFMKAMIPHHSIAILTSSRARIRDARVRALADEIIAAQKREIAVMDSLIADLTR